MWNSTVNQRYEFLLILVLLTASEHALPSCASCAAKMDSTSARETPAELPIDLKRTSASRECLSPSTLLPASLASTASERCSTARENVGEDAPESNSSNQASPCF